METAGMQQKLYLHNKSELKSKDTKYFFGWLNYRMCEGLAIYAVQFQNAVWFGMHFIESGACLSSLLSFAFKLQQSLPDIPDTILAPETKLMTEHH